MSIALLLGFALIPLGWLLGAPSWVERRRTRVASRPFPSAWRVILQRRLPYFRKLPADLQLQLKRHIQVFLDEKPFIGCAGMVITDEVRVTIAAQACMLLLNRRRPGFFPRLRQILVYPGAFVVDRLHPGGAGVLQEQRRVLSGESWSQGQVILSWADTVDGAAVVDDGHNVVLHEFAHQLDQEHGPANGAPLLPSRRRYERWSTVFDAEFRRLRAAVRGGDPTLMSPYGATDPAEFFAVATEVFFEQPARMSAEAPALYGELRGFYRIDPLAW